MTEDGDVLLGELLSQELDRAEESNRSGLPPKATPTTGEVEKEKEKQDTETHTQWALGGNGKFMPVGATVSILPSGVYEPFANPGMWGLETLFIASDGIHVLPDMATEVILQEVNKFWASEARYRAHRLLYKRGLILWGPPGGGKTVAVKLLMQELVKRNGIVIIAHNIPMTIMCLKAIRRIEPARNLIVVLEDIDEIISYNSEAAVLSMLDGENNVDNVLHVATTNYPEKLGARIINRPSRFDRRVYVGMPGAPARRAYLQKATNDGLDIETLDRWVNDTKDLSIAHLRELIAAVYCLDQSYEDVLERLRALSIPVKGEDGFKSKGMGFSGSPNQFFTAAATVDSNGGM